MFMTEKDYFAALEYRICREMLGMRDVRLTYMWCDGILPEQAIPSDRPRRITGRVWFGSSGQECWDFVLMLGRSPVAREKIDWAKLMPPNDVTGWLSLDFKKRVMKIDPRAAYADKQPMAKNSDRPEIVWADDACPVCHTRIAHADKYVGTWDGSLGQGSGNWYSKQCRACGSQLIGWEHRLRDDPVSRIRWETRATVPSSHRP